MQVQELGLQVQYQQDNGTHKFIRRCLALPFLPADQIEPQFVALRTDASTQRLQELHGEFLGVVNLK